MEVRLPRVFVLAAIAFLFAAAAARAQAPDPYLWLEDSNSARSIAWVRAENAKTLAVLTRDPRYAGLAADALKLAEAQDRIPAPGLIGADVYNFWQDAAHTRGLWRRTTPADYANPAPTWTTVLDVDALAKAERSNLIWEGADCPPPAFRRCMVSFSDGGEDAVEQREFDLATGQFVDGGFRLPRSKQSVAWLDGDTLILARDWGPGAMTASGYPFVVKTLKRGQRLDQATEVFRGQPSDVSVDPAVLHDGDGHEVVLIARGVDFFHQETWLLTPNGPVRLTLPQKLDIDGLLDGRILFRTLEPWRGYAAGSLLAYRPDELTDPASRGAGAEHLLFAPTPRQSIEEVTPTAHRVVAAIFDNVRGGLYVFAPRPGGGWSATSLAVEPNSSVGIDSTSDIDDRFYSVVDGYLAPPHLFTGDAASGQQTDIKDLPQRFDASKDAVDQYEATSNDGTKIPYFIVHPKDMKLDGSNPTILYGYGGFQESMTPEYSSTIGKLWLEKGGVYVVANIRGGGEFGPAWHEAALKTHRQVSFDDFTAVARDLIARGITSPRRLGIQGGSNGGLLVGVEFVQHPELWRAVDIQVPLLDMMRYEQIAAGASWVAEYGSVSVPAERDFLASISPYQNLKAGVAYPEPFIWTTTKDDRVGPQHARKFAAKLAALGDPYLFYEVVEGGHDSGANQKERANTTALEITYFMQRLMD